MTINPGNEEESDALHYSKCTIFKKITHGKEQNSMAHTQGKKQSIETAHEKEQLLDLLDKNFKSAILNIFKELKESWQISI